MGLAGFARAERRCVRLLRDLFEKRLLEIEPSFLWIDQFSEVDPPFPAINDHLASGPRRELSAFSREIIAASLQALLEEHILEIINRITSEVNETAICLAGGIFANVKLNQKILEHPKITKIHIFPAMGDEGTAVGAAYLSWAQSHTKRPQPLKDMYLYPGYTRAEARNFLKSEGVEIEETDNIAREIAQLIHNGKTVGFFESGMEFGPRALGHRSILAPATEADMAKKLNSQLGRSEYMPFSPITNMEEATVSYGDGWQNAFPSIGFMTITQPVTDKMKNDCPVAVHVDGTSRPQIVTKATSPNIHAILDEYKRISGINSLINTSFNLHEEPIVCSLEDAWRGFWEGDLDALYLEGCIIRKEDLLRKTGPQFAEQARGDRSFRLRSYLWDKIDMLKSEVEDKESSITEINEAYERIIQVAKERDTVIKEQKEAIERVRSAVDELIKEKDRNIENLQHIAELRKEVIESQERTIKELQRTRFLRRIRLWLTPRLGVLYQHPSRPIHIPELYHSTKNEEGLPNISIVTPSFNHGKFIERTIKSVLEQEYPGLEYVIQDGGSGDATIEVLNKYSDRLFHWESTKDKGQAHAVNTGFMHTSGEIMAYLNSDDVLLPGALHYVGDFFSSHPDVDVVYGHRVVIDEYDLEIGRWVLPPHDDSILSWADYIPQETLFWRRRIWEKVGEHMDESFRFALDWDLILRFRDAGAKLCRLPRFLGAFRVHPHHKTSKELKELGNQEMSRLRKRCHGRDVSVQEINRNIRRYLWNHVILNKLYRANIMKY